MNIVVVIDCSENMRSFIRAAEDWVMIHSVDSTLYRVGYNKMVKIGPYNIKFVSEMADVRGLRQIDILYYHRFNSAMLQWEVEHRMTSDGKIFWGLDEFMEEVFRRAENEVNIAKRKLLNGIYGAYGIDHLNSEILRQYFLSTKLYKPNAVACIKEEKTMNCDVRSNIKDVIFSDRVTVILWKDGTKTMVRAGKHEDYDPEKGFAMAVAKKMFGNKGNYYEVFKKYVPVTYYIADKKDAKKDIMMTDQAVSDEVENEIVGMIDECQGQNKIWPGLTRQKWKELVNKVAKRVTDKRKREEAEADCKKKKEGIRSGKCHWGIDLSNYMTPPEDETNNSDGEE